VLGAPQSLCGVHRGMLIAPPNRALSVSQGRHHVPLVLLLSILAHDTLWHERGIERTATIRNHEY
jgi:hypothetical protein